MSFILLKRLNVEEVRLLCANEMKLGFNEFIHERETTRSDDPSIRLFDEIILAKRNRGKSSFFSRARTDFLSDTNDHLWRTAAANPPSSRFPGDYRQIVSRSE